MCALPPPFCGKPRVIEIGLSFSTVGCYPSTKNICLLCRTSETQLLVTL